MASSSIDATLHRRYDLFINHRGPDTKKTLASHLHNRMKLEGLTSFIDKDELIVGNDFPSQIEYAIKTAFVHVAILSPRYAESEWCLNELLLMLESGAPIIPVFYHVQPNDLRRTDGKYAEALRNLENLKMHDTETNLEKPVHNSSIIKKWRDALKQVSKISGLDLQETCNGDEAKLVEMIVQNVLEKVKTARVENSCLVNLDTGNYTHMLGRHRHMRIISKPQKSDMSQKDNDHILQQSNFQDHNSALSRDPFAWKTLCNCRQMPKSKCLETEYSHMLEWLRGNFEEAPRCSTLENSRLRNELNQVKKENARLRNELNQMKKKISNEKIHQTEVFSFCKTEPVLVVGKRVSRRDNDNDHNGSGVQAFQPPLKNV